MEKVYYVSFIIGIVYSVLSVILGGILDIFNIGSDIDLGFEFPFASLLKPAVVISFLTVFGGIGLIGTNKGWKYTIFLAIILGLAVAITIWRGILVNLAKAQNTSSVKREELIGVEAVVIETILEEGVGAISYVVNGNKYSSPARSIDGSKINRGEKVIITNIKASTFFVITLSDTHHESL